MNEPSENRLRPSLLTEASAAFSSLSHNFRRTILSGLGIMVGALAIVLLVSIAKGVQKEIASQVEDLGVDVLVVVPGRIDAGTFNPNLGGFSYLSVKNCTDLDKVPGVVRADPFTFLGGGIRVGNKTADPLLVATTPGWFIMHPTDVTEGRVLTHGDDHADVAVLGSIAKKALFGDIPAVGKMVTVNGRKYRVVGVVKEKSHGQSLMNFGSFENLVYLPFVRSKELNPSLSVMRIMVQSAPDAEPKKLISALNKTLGKSLNYDQYQVLTEEDLLGLVYKITGIITWLLVGLTSIGLFVGGVGIMTVMLLAVSERSGEIGIRKAVGASRGSIFRQFLIESTSITLMGGFAGLLFGVFVDFLLARFTPITPNIDFNVVALAIGASGFAGILFGVWPATRAARRDPVECLRL